MLAAGHAPTAATARPAELDAMREAQRARGEKTALRRPLAARAGQDAAAGARRRGAGDALSQPGRRRGAAGTTWSRARSRSATDEIDDLVIVRADGMPTYNFAVVVDDWDMRDQPRVPRRRACQQHAVADQHLPRARRAAAGCSRHVPMILGDDGQKLSKRRGAVSVTAYEDEGYLPEAMLNYLARLGWSHGDEETLQPRADGAVVRRRPPRKSPAQWDAAKLAWVNAHYLKAWPTMRAGRAGGGAAARRGIDAPADERLLARCARCSRTAAPPTSSSPTGWRCSSCRVQPSAADRRRSMSPTPCARRSRTLARQAGRRAPGTQAGDRRRRSRRRWPRTA